eukprot:GHVP01002939.1.p1 GENE.GHVP01002939.1~~GHVP01002939.1.p1  ORF type:complete len:214 (+),score=40.01 GHVP01002939.1:369-1010(+)
MKIFKRARIYGSIIIATMIGINITICILTCFKKNRKLYGPILDPNSKPACEEPNIPDNTQEFINNSKGVVENIQENRPVIVEKNEDIYTPKDKINDYLMENLLFEELKTKTDMNLYVTCVLGKTMLKKIQRKKGLELLKDERYKKDEYIVLDLLDSLMTQQERSKLLKEYIGNERIQIENIRSTLLNNRNIEKVNTLIEKTVDRLMNRVMYEK